MDTQTMTNFKIGDKVRRIKDGWRIGTIVEICPEKGLALTLESEAFNS